MLPSSPKHNSPGTTWFNISNPVCYQNDPLHTNNTLTLTAYAIHSVHFYIFVYFLHYLFYTRSLDPATFSSHSNLFSKHLGDLTDTTQLGQVPCRNPSCGHAYYKKRIKKLTRVVNVAADRRHRCCSSKAMAFKEPVSQQVSQGGGSQGVNADSIFPAAVHALSTCTAQSTAGS